LQNMEEREEDISELIPFGMVTILNPLSLSLSFLFKENKTYIKYNCEGWKWEGKWKVSSAERERGGNRQRFSTEIRQQSRSDSFCRLRKKKEEKGTGEEKAKTNPSSSRHRIHGRTGSSGVHFLQHLSILCANASTLKLCR